jgi:hypothetical protein
MAITDNNIENSEEKLKENNIIKVLQEQKAESIQIERERFWNLFGFVPDKYIRFFNIVIIEIFVVLFFTLVYYILLSDFDTHFFAPDGYPKRYFTHHKILTALFLSINLQSTTSYLAINFKSIFVRCIINLQLIITIAILFFFVSN